MFTKFTVSIQSLQKASWIKSTQQNVNRETSPLTHKERNVTYEDDNIIPVCSTSIILFIFMGDIFFLYMSNVGCFTFIFHHSELQKYKYEKYK